MISDKIRQINTTIADNAIIDLGPIIGSKTDLNSFVID